MNTLLIIGGTGFFGRSILDAHRRGLLCAFGVGRLVAVARHAHRLRAEAPELCTAAVELVDADVLTLDSTFDADVVIHAAASSDARRYGADPAAEMRIIVDGTRRVCDVIRNARRRPRFLYVSSGAVYGRQRPDKVALAESDAPSPDVAGDKAAYAQAKRAAESIVRSFAAETNVPACIARCFAFVGPWLPRDEHFAIGNFIGNALRGEPVELRARHSVIRSYLHADDLAVWLLRLATAAGDGCEAVNVGSGEAVQLRDVASMVAAAGGVGVRFPEASGEALPPPDRYVPDISKARNELGLTVTIPLREAIERTLRALPATASQRTRDAHAPAGVAR